MDRFDKRLGVLENKARRIEGLVWYLAGLLSINILGHEAVGFLGLLWRVPL